MVWSDDVFCSLGIGIDSISWAPGYMFITWQFTKSIHRNQGTLSYFIIISLLDIDICPDQHHLHSSSTPSQPD